MSLRRRFTLPTIAGCVVLSLVVSLTAGTPFLGDGRLYDLALWGRSQLDKSDAPSPTGVIVIAVDRRSLDSESLKDTPRALFGPAWGKLIRGLGDAGAKVVAFDLLLAFSGNRFSAGYDRDFLSALFAHRDKIILARSDTVLPAKPYQAALRFDPGALGLIEIQADRDEVFRRIASHFSGSDGTQMRSLVGAALARAGVDDIPAEIILAPSRHLEAVPSVALADILNCIDQAPESLAPVFERKLVFVGSALAKEDRVLTSGRYLPAHVPTEKSLSDSCPLPLTGASNPASRSVPGVYLHAAAADAVLNQNNVAMAPQWSLALTAAVAGGAGAAIGLSLAPWTAGLLAVLAMVLLWTAEAYLIDLRLWYAAALPMFAVAASTILAYVVRYLAEERRRRGIQRAFGRYLAPSIVDSLVEHPEDLQLGGTVRPVTVMFADLSGFTALSTTVGPEELVRLTNEYLAFIADEVDQSGGYVDKYIGDAVMAIWGAPVPDDSHATEAVEAGLAILARIRDTAEKAKASGGHAFGIKIGMHSGDAIVGNVGSSQRYNYTAVGETVNIAARMESLPGVYSCSFLIGPTTAEIVGDRMLTREIDWVAVKGRDEPLAIYEVLATEERATQQDLDAVERYDQALQLYRSRKFGEAASNWKAMGPDDGPAQIMAARAEEYAETPPPADWDGVFVMSGK